MLCSRRTPLAAPRLTRPRRQGVEAILEEALTADVAFLVVGDPFAATTHADLQLRAKCVCVRRSQRYTALRLRRAPLNDACAAALRRQMGVAVTVVHNASIMNGVRSLQDLF